MARVRATRPLPAVRRCMQAATLAGALIFGRGARPAPEARPITAPPKIAKPAKPVASNAAPAPVTIAPDADGFLPLPLKGMRAVELTLEERARIEVRVSRENTGRFIARRRPPEATDPAAGEPVAFEISKERGIVYVDSVTPKPGLAPDSTPVSIVIELPLRTAFSLDARDADVTIFGAEPLPILDDLPPRPAEPLPRPDVWISQGVPPTPMVGPRAAPGTRPAGAPGPASPDASGSAPGSASGGPGESVGGALDIRFHQGLFTARDLVNNLTVEKESGDVVLTRLSGRVVVKAGAGLVRASALQGLLTVDGAAGVEATALGGGIDIRRAGGRIRLRGIGGDAKLALDQADCEVEDVRGRTEARLNLTAGSLRDLTGSVQVNGDNSDITLERLGGTTQVRANGGSVRLRDLFATLDLSGTPLSVDIEGARGPVTVNSGGRGVRVRDIRGPLTIQCAEGDIEVDQATGAVNLVSASGRVRLTGAPKIARITGDTIEVELSGALDPFSEHFYTGKRSVDVSLPAGKYDLKVRAGGSVDSDFPFDTIGKPGVAPGFAPGAPGAPGALETPVQQADPGGTVQAPGGSWAPRPIPPTRVVTPPPGRSGPVGRAGPRLTISCDGDVGIREG